MTTQIAGVETRCSHMGYSFRLQGFFCMHTTAFVTHTQNKTTTKNNKQQTNEQNSNIKLYIGKTIIFKGIKQNIDNQVNEQMVMEKPLKN